MRTPPG